MFCIVTALGVHILYCDSVRRTCFVLLRCYVCMFFIVKVLRVHVFFVTVLCVHVLCCESDTREKIVKSNDLYHSTKY